MSRPVNNIAAEILDHIFFFVEDPPDLLNVALASKQCHSIVASRHIENRVISCDPKRLALWERLASSDTPAIALSSHMMACLELIPTEFDMFNFYPCARAILPQPLLQYDHPDGLRFLSVVEDEDGEEDGEEEEKDEDMDEVKWRRILGAACARALSNAIRGMPNLTRIHFRSCDVASTHELFSALLEGCEQLRDVDIECDINEGFSGTGVTKVEDGLATSPLWKLANLTRFNFTSIWSGDVDIPVDADTFHDYTALMVDMLVNRCPNLEDLSIDYQMDLRAHTYPDDHIGILLRSASWPRLKRLAIPVSDEPRSTDYGSQPVASDYWTVIPDAHDQPPSAENPTVQPDDSFTEALHSFFARHQTLETLSILGHLSSLVIDNLPNLRFLQLQKLPKQEHSFLSPGVGRRIEGLCITNPYLNTSDYGTSTHIADLQRMLTSVPNLRSFILARDQVHSQQDSEMIMNFVFSRTAPQIQRLALRYDAFTCPTTIDHICNFIAQFPSLTHLSYHNRSPELYFPTPHSHSDSSSHRHGSRYEDHLHPEMHDALSEFASAAPSLRFVELQEDQWIAIERNEYGEYAGGHRTRKLLDRRRNAWKPELKLVHGL